MLEGYMRKLTSKPSSSASADSLRTPGRKLGTLVVVVAEAKNLHNNTLRDKAPYCVLRLDDQTLRTKAIKHGGEHPEWDEELRFLIYETPEDELARIGDEGGGNAPPPPTKADRNAHQMPKRIMHLACYVDNRGEADLVGETTFDVTKAINKGEMDGFFAITSKQKYCGEVYLEMTYWSEPLTHTPPPQYSYGSTVHGLPGASNGESGNQDSISSNTNGGAEYHQPSPAPLSSASGMASSFSAMSISDPASNYTGSSQHAWFSGIPSLQGQYYSSSGPAQVTSTSTGLQQYPSPQYVLVASQQSCVPPSLSMGVHEPASGTVAQGMQVSTLPDPTALIDDIGSAITWISPNPVKVNGHFCDVFEGVHVKAGKVALKRPRIGVTGYNDDEI
ncbi:hypothetical protein FRC01_007771, partial [Tulasnella sp. 417]